MLNRYTSLFITLVLCACTPTVSTGAAGSMAVPSPAASKAPGSGSISPEPSAPDAGTAKPPAAGTAAGGPGTSPDVAISGPGYMVVSKGPGPVTGWKDVTLINSGRLTWTYDAVASPPPGGETPGAWTLRTQDGSWVLGFELASDPEPRLPKESASMFHTVALQFDGVGVAPLTLLGSAGQMPDAAIDARGRVTVGGQAPTTADGKPRWLYLAALRVESPTRLTKVEGGFQYNQGARFAFVGIAGLRSSSKDSRPVGDTFSFVGATGGAPK